MPRVRVDRLITAQNRPVSYWHVDDIRKTLETLIDSGAQASAEISNVGGGKLVASVKDADGNVIGLVQTP